MRSTTHERPGKCDYDPFAFSAPINPGHGVLQLAGRLELTEHGPLVLEVEVSFTSAGC